MYFLNKRLNFIGGVGVFNINRPNQGFLGQKIRREIRTEIFVNGIYKLNHDFDLVPGIKSSIQGKYREFMIGSSVEIHIN